MSLQPIERKTSGSPDAFQGSRADTIGPQPVSEGDRTNAQVVTGPSPAPPNRTVRWLSYLIFDPAILILTSFFGVLSLLASIWDKSGKQQHAIARAWARALLCVTHSPVSVRGFAKLQGISAAVYACNHLSYMDTPVLFAHLPFQFRIFAKQSLWKLPFIGWHLRRSGQVPVDQATARKSVASLNLGVSALRGGMPLVLFPEGGRSATGSTQGFLPGAAFMAIRAKVPLVPVTLVGTYELLPMHVYALRPRPLKLIFGEPISTDHLTTRDADDLTRRVYEVITATYLSEDKSGERM